MNIEKEKTKLEKEISKLEKEDKIWQIKKKIIQKKTKIRRDKIHTIIDKKMSTSKMLIVFLFLNCTVVEVFSLWIITKMVNAAMVNGTMVDSAPLVALIGAVIGEVVGFGIYSLKSTKENTKGGIIYENAIRNLSEENNDETFG